MQCVLENSTVLTIIIIITLSHNSPHFKTNTIHIQSNEAAAAASCWTPIEACQYIYADILNAASIFVWIPPEVAEWAESWRFGLRPLHPACWNGPGQEPGGPNCSLKAEPQMVANEPGAAVCNCACKWSYIWCVWWIWWGVSGPDRSWAHVTYTQCLASVCLYLFWRQRKHI